MEDGRWQNFGRARQFPLRNATAGQAVRSALSRNGGGHRTARPTITNKAALDPELGLGGRAVGADTILDGHAAEFVPTERRINQTVVVTHMAVDDGEVFLLDGARFPDFADFAGSGGIFGDEYYAAGFTVEAVNQTRLKGGS